MDEKTLKEMLEKVASGRLDAGSAARQIVAGGASSDLGYARLDMSRSARCGFPEFIFGEGKTPAQICGIMEELKASGRPVLATRVSAEAATMISSRFPEAELDELAKTAAIRQGVEPLGPGYVLIATAGTSDLPSALEAKVTAELCGCETKLLADAGVAGLHRLLAERKLLEEASVVIAAAGMEGALPSVLAGLVSCPVVALPTGVGYGASFGGLAALLAMLNSCASGVAVVNIGNGFGAACAAARIMRLLGRSVSGKA